MFVDYFKVLSEEFIRNHKDELNWLRICENQSLSEAFIIEHADYVNWDYVAYYQKLSEKFIRDNFSLLTKCSNTYICEKQVLSENFISEFRNHLDWVIISTYQKLSEKFMRQNHKRIVWNFAFVYQKFSFRFAWLMRWHICDVRIKISANQNLSEQFKRRFIAMYNKELRNIK
jgi:hypothetical protein